jgi:cytochrome c-type biogenesis protein CcmH/NrfG
LGLSRGGSIRVCPYLTDAWIFSGDSYRHLKRFKEAVSAYDSALALDPRNGSARKAKNKVLESLRAPAGR